MCYTGSIGEPTIGIVLLYHILHDTCCLPDPGCQGPCIYFVDSVASVSY